MRTIELSAFETSFTERFTANVRDAGLSTEEVGRLSMEIANMAIDTRPRLLVDVSELSAADAGSGIQRVVRNILMHLLVDAVDEMRVEPVYTDPHTREFRFARRFTSEFLGVD